VECTNTSGDKNYMKLLTCLITFCLLLNLPAQDTKLPEPTYTYHGTIIDIYDGDTMTAMLDLGFDVWVKARIRIEGIDTPELRGIERERGIEARNYVRKLLLDQPVVVTTRRKEKYGRWLAAVHFLHEGKILDLSTHLLETDRAIRYE